MFGKRFKLSNNNWYTFLSGYSVNVHLRNNTETSNLIMYTQIVQTEICRIC